MGPLLLLTFSSQTIASFFSQATLGEATTIKNILSHYESLSGQKVNVEKSEISFSSKLAAHSRDSITSCLGFVEVAMHGKYLGLPTMFDQSKRISFAALRDRVWKKLQGWKEKLLSRAGKPVRRFLSKRWSKQSPIMR